MPRKFYIAYVSLTAIALLAGVIAFTAALHGQAHAQGTAKTASVHCFIGNKMDRPDTRMNRGWVCVSDTTPVVTN